MVELNVQGARYLSRRLRQEGAKRLTTKVLLGRPIGDIRDMRLWLSLVSGSTLRAPDPTAALEDFIDSRRALRRCKHCGCTSDNGCVDPGMSYVCPWVGPDLCSGCLGRERS